MDSLEELRKAYERRLGAGFGGTALPKELPVIKSLSVKYARMMEKDGHPVKVLTFLWEDGSITSCAFDSKNSVQCCHSSAPGQDGAYWPWISHLASLGYKEHPIEVENELAKVAPPTEITERITAGADVR